MLREGDVTPRNSHDQNHLLYFCCPITGKLFIDPVIASDGCTYEREAIIAYLKNRISPISPVTNKPFANTELRSDEEMRRKVMIYKDIIANSTDEVQNTDNVSKFNVLPPSHIFFPKIVVPASDSENKSAVTKTSKTILRLKLKPKKLNTTSDSEDIEKKLPTIQLTNKTVQTDLTQQQLIFNDEASLKIIPAPLQLQFLTLLQNMVKSDDDYRNLIKFFNINFLNYSIWQDWPQLIKTIMQNADDEVITHQCMEIVVTFLSEKCKPGKKNIELSITYNNVLRIISSIHYFYANKVFFQNMITKTAHTKRLEKLENKLLIGHSITHITDDNFNFLNFPEEIKNHILSFIDLAATLINFAMTCKDNLGFVNDECILQSVEPAKTFIHFLRDHGFSNFDIFKCFPLLRNNKYRPKLSSKSLYSLLSWRSYLVPIDMIYATKQFVLLYDFKRVINTSVYIDLYQEKQNYIQRLAVFFPDLMNHRFISSIISAPTHYYYEILIQFMNKLHAADKYPVLNGIFMRALKSQSQTIANGQLNVLYDLMSLMEFLSQLLDILGNMPKTLKNLNYHLTLPRIETLLCHYVKIYGIDNQANIDFLKNLFELLRDNLDSLHQSQNIIMIDTIFKCLAKYPPAQSQKLARILINKQWFNLWIGANNSILEIGVIHIIEKGDVVNNIILLDHLCRIINNSKYLTKLTCAAKSALIIKLYRDNQIDKVNTLLDTLNKSITGISLAPFILTVLASKHAAKSGNHIDEMIQLAEMLTAVHVVTSHYPCLYGIPFDVSHKFKKQITIVLSQLLTKFSFKEIYLILELIRRLSIDQMKLFMDNLVTADSDSLKQFLDECNQLNNNAHQYLLLCCLLTAAVHGINGASSFLRLIKRLSDNKTVSARFTATPAERQYHIMLDLLFHSCIKSVQLHGFAGINELEQRLESFKTNEGYIDANISTRLIKELCVYIVVNGCKNLSADFELIQRNCIVELYKNRTDIPVEKSENKSLTRQGIFAQPTQNVQLNKFFPQLYQKILLPQEQLQLNDFIKNTKMLIEHEHRNSSKLFKQSTDAQVEYLFLTLLQHLLSHPNSIQFRREQKIKNAAIKFLETYENKKNVDHTSDNEVFEECEKSGLEARVQARSDIQSKIDDHRQKIRRESVEIATMITTTIYNNFTIDKLSPQVRSFIQCVKSPTLLLNLPLLKNIELIRPLSISPDRR